MTEQQGFEHALRELEQIVRAIEADEVDVDELADKVDRAAELVQYCRDRLAATELRVNEIIGGLDGEDEA